MGIETPRRVRASLIGWRTEFDYSHRCLVTHSPPLPDDLLVNAADEVRIRQDLVLVALGKRTADFP